MKKSLLALAVLGAFAGAASAQSSVTLFGVIDQAVAYQKTNGSRLVSLDSNDLSSNRLGFRGIEDLGGGLKAGFWLEAGMNNDVGTAGGSNGLGSTALFNRRSTVSLMGNFGEIRLGRDYTPTFWNTVLYDVFGANGFGEGYNLNNYGNGSLGSGAVATVRANNSVAYWLPSNLGGLYGRAMVAGGEGTSGGKYYGGSLNWAGGPIDVGAGYGVTKIFGNTLNNSNFKVANVGASYDFGVAKVYAYYNQATWSPRKLKTVEVSVGVPIGANAVNASYTHGSYSGSLGTAAQQAVYNGKGDQFAVQYVYNLSKRTSLYGTLAHLQNKSNATFSFQDGLPTAPGKSENGANVGIRHSF